MTIMKAIDDFIAAMHALPPEERRYLAIGLSEKAIDHLEFEMRPLTLDATSRMTFRMSRHPGKIAMVFKGVPIVTVNQEIK